MYVILMFHGETHTVTTEEARRLWEQLDDLFAVKTQAPHRYEYTPMWVAPLPEPTPPPMYPDRHQVWCGPAYIL